MRPIVQFEAFVRRCVPWSMPDIGIGRTKAGRPIPLFRKSPDLEAWQEHVRERARAAMAGSAPAREPAAVFLEFYRHTPPGRHHGEPWGVTVERDVAKGRYVKRGRASPDLDNLIKAVLDALQGVVLADDALVVRVTGVRLYGPQDGVRVRVHALEPGEESPIAWCAGPEAGTDAWSGVAPARLP